MATKNIARSALEGGRPSREKDERRQSHVAERASVKNYCRRVKNDPECADEEIYEPIKPAWTEFTDKLSPMYRWLEKQIGRPWADVRSEVAKKFDIRTTAGRHITYDHLLYQVVDTESGFDKRGHMIDPNIELSDDKNNNYGYSMYYVDQDGILQINGETHSHRKRHYYGYRLSEAECIAAAEWLNGNMIGFKDGKYYWFAPMEGIWKASFLDGPKDYWYYPPKLRYFLLEKGAYEKEVKTPVSWNREGFVITKIKTSGPHWEHIENPFSFRQRGELTKEELKHFMGLKETIRNQILNFGKGR